MSNNLIKSLVGKVCTIATGTFGTTFTNVTVIEVLDNWVKIEDKKGKTNLVNTDYITSIQVF